MNIDLSLPLKQICTAMHMHTNIHTHIQIPVPCYSQRECDYAVHFVRRHPLDRCICWANLDGFSVWILNQNHIFSPLPCCESPTCLPCLLPPPAIIHWQSCVGKNPTLLWILIFTACWSCVMNESNIYTCIWTPRIRWVRNILSLFHAVIFLTFLWQIVLRSHSLYLSLFVLCLVFSF